MQLLKKLAVLGGWCALVVITALHLPRLGFDNDTWLAEDNPQRIELDQFREEFNPHEALLVVIELEDDFFAPTQIEKIKRIDAALSALPETHSVLSPVSGTTIVDSGDTLEIGSFGDALEKGHIKDIAAYRQKFLDSPYADKLLSPDHRQVLINVNTERSDAVGRAVAMKAITQTLNQHGFTNARFAGESALKDELNRITVSQLPLLLGLAALVLAIFLRIACGNVLRAAVIFATAVAAVSSCLGIMAAFGWPMNAVLLLLPVMVAVIAVADGLHILASWDALENLPHKARLKGTIAQSWLPCLGATVTSAAGFGAFALSELEPLQHFGFASTLSIAYAYPLITGASWGAMYIFPGMAKTPPQRGAWTRLIATAEHGASIPTRVVLGTLIFATLLGAGLSMIRTETNFLAVFFSERSDVRQSFDLVDEQLGGSSRIEVVLRAAPESFASADSMHAVDALSARFATVPTVNHVENYLLPVEMADEAFGGDGRPDGDGALAQELLFLSLSRSETDRGVLAPYLDLNHATARLSLQTPNLDSRQLDETITAIRALTAAAAGEIEGSSGIAQVTGFGVFIHNLGEHVLRTQALSILLTLAIIGLLLLVQFGFRDGLAGLLANLLPLAATTGLIAWLGYPYDFATILIAGVTLGLSVDATIHFLHHYRHDPKKPLQRALERTARPIAVTTVLFCCGLGVVAFSDLVVLRRFAGFTMFGMGAALAAVLLFLPAILAILHPRRGRPATAPRHN